ncbi:MAG TPA: serine/threonine-protein kinase, partial [Vicinamibacterales bacterium]|nr:serine/threonine-protein kinase [Vicinamibacterales bacterium]
MRLGPYELAGRIGSGGMGQVYEARDTRLGRTVALKVLPADAVGNPEARARFLREAKLAAALNHPNIVTIYDADVDGTGREARLYIAMERVVGRSLAELIGGKLPEVATALDWAAQIADALRHAHEAGIVHRDLKPANVMLGADGRIKVLDFGLAKQMLPDPADPTAATASFEAATGTGVVLGTIAYMSPEQAEGRRVDARSDLFSFGVLLYELLTGERPFRGDSAASVIGSLLRDTPLAPSDVRPGLPVDLDHILEKALAKKPDERYQHADDLLVDLRAAARKVTSPAATASVAAAAPAAGAPRRWLVPAIAAVAALAALAAWVWMPTEAPPAETMRFVSPLPEGFSFENAGGFGSSIAIAPDGSTIVLAAHSETEKTSVLLRQKVGDFSAVPIPQTRGARAPFISYDGQWVGFVTGQDVSRVRLTGDAAKDSAGIEAAGTMLEPESLTSVDTAFFGGDFDRKGNTILIGECTRGLRAWSLSAKVKERVSSIAPQAPGVFQHQFPQTLPDGEHLLLTAWRNSGA